MAGQGRACAEGWPCEAPARRPPPASPAEASGHKPANTLASEFQPPELRENKCLMHSVVVLCYGSPWRQEEERTVE